MDDYYFEKLMKILKKQVVAEDETKFYKEMNKKLLPRIAELILYIEKVTSNNKEEGRALMGSCITTILLSATRSIDEAISVIKEIEGVVCNMDKEMNKE